MIDAWTSMFNRVTEYMMGQWTAMTTELHHYQLKFLDHFSSISCIYNLTDIVYKPVCATAGIDYITDVITINLGYKKKCLLNNN